MSTPFDLDAGLRLEKANLVLPWDTDFESLCHLGTPEVFRHPSATNILWNEELVLGSVPATVSAMTAAGSNVFYLSPATACESAHEEFSLMLNILTSRLGSPSSSVVEGGYPWVKWLWGEVGVSLRIGERFTEYVSLMVAKGIFHVEPER